MKKLIIFDSDGTLIDTFTLIEQSIIQTFAVEFPSYQYSMSEIHAFFGPLIDESFGKYTNDSLKIEHCIKTYRDFYYQNLLKYLVPFNGISELLLTLKEEGFTLAVFSNTKKAILQRNLEQTGIYHYFDDVIGIDFVKSKPDPEGLMYLMSKYNVTRTIFVGDSFYDFYCARNAQISLPELKFVGVTWAQNTKGDFAAMGVETTIDSPSELRKVAATYYDL